MTDDGSELLTPVERAEWEKYCEWRDTQDFPVPVTDDETA
jgi:hypothetical protein